MMVWFRRFSFSFRGPVFSGFQPLILRGVCMFIVYGIKRLSIKMSKFCCKISLLNGLDIWELGAVGFGNDLHVAKSRRQKV